MTKRMAGLIITLLTLFALTSCGGAAAQAPASNAAPVVVRMATGTVPSTITGVIFARPDALPLRHYGKSYTVDLHSVNGTSELIPALASKQVDVAYGSPPSLNATINGAHVDVKVVGDMTDDGKNGYFSSSWLVLDNGPIKTVDDLKGKKIGVLAFNTAVDLALRVMLKKHNIDPKKDTTIIEVPFPQEEATLRQGKIDAAVLAPPFYQIAMGKGGLRKLFDSNEALGPTPALFQIARTEFATQHPQVMRDMFEDYLIGLKWLMDPANRDKAISLISSITKQPTSLFQSYLFTKGDFYRSPDGTFDVNTLKQVDQLMVDQGIAKDQVDVSKVVDFSYMQAAQKAAAK